MNAQSCLSCCSQPCNKASKLMQHNYAPMLHTFLQGWLRAQTNSWRCISSICTNNTQSCFYCCDQPCTKASKEIQQTYDPMLIVKLHKLFVKMIGGRNKKVHIIPKLHTYPIAANASTFALPAFTPPASHMEADVIVSCRECKRANMDCILTVILGQGVISGSFVGESRVFLIRIEWQNRT